MHEAEAPPPPSRHLSHGLAPTLGRFAWPAAFVAIAAMSFAYLRDAREKPSGTSEVRVEHAGVTVVRELRALARLETSTLRVEKVIELKDHQKRLHGLVDADDALLFVGAGEVVLGVDLAKLGDEDIRTDAATGIAYVELPAPEVLSARFDESRSYVHHRKTDVFAERNEGLEAAARKEALAAFEAAGKEPSAMDAAKANAEKELRVLAKAWGAKDLVVTWKAPRGEVALERK